MCKRILVWLTTVYMFFAWLFGFSPKKPKPDFPAQADYVEVLEALKEAFADGEYQVFLDAYPRPNINDSEEKYQKIREWPLLLQGVTAEMVYDIDDFTFAGDYSCSGTAMLDVKNGNGHLPNGRQLVRLELVFENTDMEKPALYSMSLATDGRWVEFATDSLIEHQIYLLSCDIALFAHTTLMRSICFLNMFDSNETRQYTADEIIAAARKFLGVDYSLAEIEKDREGDAMLSYDKTSKDRYSIVEGCVIGPSVRVKLLGATREDNIACRAFIYANSFLLEITETRDCTFRVLKNPDSTEYAQLLSVTTDK